MKRDCFQVEGYLIFPYKDSKAVPYMLAFLSDIPDVYFIVFS